MEHLTAYLKDSDPVVLSASACAILLAGIGLAKTFSGPPKGLVYPPGPPQDLVIGSLRSFPKDKFYEKFLEWQKTYGDIVYLYLPGMPIMIINSLDMAQELVAKSRVSDRKVQYMVKELLGWTWSMGFRNADAIHAQQRKLLRRGIGPQRIAAHDAIVERSASQLLLEMQGKSGNPHMTVVHAIGRVVITVAYGERIWAEDGLELIDLNLQALKLLLTTFNNFFLVDVFPILRFIPSWMPGAEFRRRGIKSTELTDRIRTWPFQRILELHANKELGHCLAADLLEEFGPTDDVRDSLGILYFAGVDTTASTIHHALNCLMLFPEVATQVQQEIGRVVGNDRLPRMTDRNRLPYTEAVWKECLRWNTPVPLGIPHVNKTEETINGYYIPKGTILNPNIGFMLMDPKIWGDPEIFRPERHLVENGPPNPSTIVFGFGSRTCPGRFLADRVGFYVIATIMSVYRVLPPEGKPLPDWRKVEYVGDLVRYPTEFECRFEPKSEKAANLLSALSIAGHD